MRPFLVYIHEKGKIETKYANKYRSFTVEFL